MRHGAQHEMSHKALGINFIVICLLSLQTLQDYYRVLSNILTRQAEYV